MNKLSQEAEDYINQQDYSVLVDKDKNAIYRFGMKAALINPILLEKQGLISLEDADDFVEWKGRYLKSELKNGLRLNNPKGKEIIEKLCNYTTAQLFQIYQEQKEK